MKKKIASTMTVYICWCWSFIKPVSCLLWRKDQWCARLELCAAGGPTSSPRPWCRSYGFLFFFSEGVTMWQYIDKASSKKSDRKEQTCSCSSKEEVVRVLSLFSTAARLLLDPHNNKSRRWWYSQASPPLVAPAMTSNDPPLPNRIWTTLYWIVFFTKTNPLPLLSLPKRLLLLLYLSQLPHSTHPNLKHSNM